MKNTRSPIARACQQCGALFYPLNSGLWKGKGIFCSRACTFLAKRRPLTRIWEFGQRQESGCLEWTQRRDSLGYGKVAANGREALVHRIAWTLTHGPIPPGLLVCHHCDNPPCFEPEHLFLGTYRDNGQDMARKGRSASQRHPDLYLGRSRNLPRLRGVDNVATKLTEGAIREIRHRYATGGISQQALAAEYGVTQTNIGQIVRRKTWQHVE